MIGRRRRKRPDPFQGERVKPQAEYAAEWRPNDPMTPFRIACVLNAAIAYIDFGCAPDLDPYIETRLRRAYAGALTCCTPSERATLAKTKFGACR